MAENHSVSLAVDLGASSGRLVAGFFDGKRFQLEDVHRFANGGIRAANRLQWDVLGLWNEIQEGLRQANFRYGNSVRSVGVNTWGVDFGFLGSDGLLLSNPFHYRDRQTDGVFEQAFEVVSREDIFQATGLQFMPFNSLFQLFAMKRDGSVVLDNAERFLMMPDLFHWLLTGEASNEETDASTTQFYDPRSRNWSRDLLDRFELPHHFLGELSPPGTVLGKFRREVAEFTGLNDTQVVLPGAHDTASAVLAVPAASNETPNWCYISSGTWSLMGVETQQPIINERVRALNFTNEGGVGGTTRLLKNIGGLWLIQECRRIWDLAGEAYDWSQLVEMAQHSTPFGALIDPDDASLLAPDDMPAAIRQYCIDHGQSPPDSSGAVIRCALESLALRYRAVLNHLEELVGQRIETIHIVGGGTQNQLLCQMTANACRRPVVAGPIEATALGNLMVQAIALGEIDSIQQARDIIRTSFDAKEYAPVDGDSWEEAFDRFQAITSAR